MLSIFSTYNSNYLTILRNWMCSSRCSLCRSFGHNELPSLYRMLVDLHGHARERVAHVDRDVDWFQRYCHVWMRASSPLPDGWRRYIDQNSGREYFHHAATSTSTANPLTSFLGDRKLYIKSLAHIFKAPPRYEPGRWAYCTIVNGTFNRSAQ